MPEDQFVIDEIQKVPALLDEVHWLIENRGLHFALCGSSARKVRRGAANLLGGRALRYELHGLTANELGNEFVLSRMLNHGYLPRMYEAGRPARRLDAYVADYLKEEVAAEGLVRNLPAFSGFLDAAALCDGEMINFSNIASDCAVSSPTAKAYFGILEDTLLGRWLPAWRKRRKRRLIRAPKFYFFDVGVVNRLVRRGPLVPGSELYGRALENWVFHELSAFRAYRAPNDDLCYWRLAGGTEVDFVLGDMRLAVEAKASARIASNHLRGLRSLADEHPEARRRIVVCWSRGRGARTTASTSFRRRSSFAASGKRISWRDRRRLPVPCPLRRRCPHRRQGAAEGHSGLMRFGVISHRARTEFGTARPSTSAAAGDAPTDRTPLHFPQAEFLAARRAAGNGKFVKSRRFSGSGRRSVRHIRRRFRT